MKITSLLIFLTLLSKAQTFNNLDFTISMVLSNYFPGNIGEKLESKGFILISSKYVDDNHILATYVSDKKDEFYYNVFLVKQGEIRSISLTFNERSKNSQYEKMLLDIKEYMTKENDVYNNDNNYSVYIDNSGYYYAYTSFYSTGHKQKLYTIEIMNNEAFNIFKK